MRNFVFALLALVLLTSCAFTTKEAFYNNAPEEWTHTQKTVAYYHALQQWGTVALENATGRQIRSDLVSLDDVHDLLVRMQDDLEWATEGDRAYAEYLLWNESREGIYRQRDSLQAMTACIQAYRVQNQFAELFNTSIGHLDTDAYDVRLLVACPELQDQLNFDDPRIVAARERGRLEHIRSVTTTLETEQSDFTLRAEVYRERRDRTADPTQPEAEWREADRQRPPDYVEVFRDDLEEPFARLYRLPGDTALTYAVFDSDLPGNIGYGLPDILRPVFVGSSLQWAAEQVQDLYDESFAQNHLVIDPEHSPIEYHVFRAGQTIDVWEYGEFNVPFSYEDDSFLYNVVFDEDGNLKDNLRPIAWLETQYTNSRGNIFVVERYEPSDEYRQVRLAYAFSTGIELTTPDQPVIQAPASVLGSLQRVLYLEGESAWELMDSNGDGVWDARRQIAWPYSTNTASDYQGF